jgi:hypothetical protein
MYVRELKMGRDGEWVDDAQMWRRGRVMYKLRLTSGMLACCAGLLCSVRYT